MDYRAFVTWWYIFTAKPEEPKKLRFCELRSQNLNFPNLPIPWRKKDGA